ncbi:hypothetical protein [Fodinibius sp.]|uniref:hypothetical protein n=1 Tax=Fodinibius sp. TaxID=1872440 RepID=UPI002ACDA3EC|nr:hypothetical protein [Fodinibius sp.]MDZ7658492.1 hypothetical protein [Fodinibius sp.]
MQPYKTVPLILALVFIIFTTLITPTHAQTVYDDEPGFFTPVIESFYLQGGIFEDTQLIGPAVGYRFNNRYDVSLHSEFLFSELKYSSSNNSRLSILNLGITAGQINHWDNNLLLRNELSIYHSFNVNLENYQGLTNPSLTSILGVSSIYKSLSISDNITFMPNIGALAGIGDYQPPISSGNLRQGFDGFVAGPQLGLDTKFSVSKSFSITVKPQYRLRYNFTQEHSGGTLTFNVLLNF